MNSIASFVISIKKDEDKHKNELLDHFNSNFIYYNTFNLLNFAIPKKSIKENSNLIEIKNFIKNIILNYINYLTYGLLYKIINNVAQTFYKHSKILEKKEIKIILKIINIINKKRFI